MHVCRLCSLRFLPLEPRHQGLSNRPAGLSKHDALHCYLSGDARDTCMGRRRGEVNLGQLMREKFGEDKVHIIGQIGCAAFAEPGLQMPVRLFLVMTPVLLAACCPIAGKAHAWPAFKMSFRAASRQGARKASTCRGVFQAAPRHGYPAAYLWLARRRQVPGFCAPVQGASVPGARLLFDASCLPPCNRYHGQVAATDEWGAPVKMMDLTTPIDGAQCTFALCHACASCSADASPVWRSMGALNQTAVQPEAAGSSLKSGTRVHERIWKSRIHVTQYSDPADLSPCMESCWAPQAAMRRCCTKITHPCAMGKP